MQQFSEPIDSTDVRIAHELGLVDSVTTNSIRHPTHVAAVLEND